MRGHLNSLAQDGAAILMRIGIVMRGCLHVEERLGDGDGGVIRVEVGVAFKSHLASPLALISAAGTIGTGVLFGKFSGCCS